MNAGITILRDLRFAIKSLSRSPGFTLIALITLGLGIGTVLLIAIARIAGYMPARYASRISPIEALRAE